MPFRCGNCAYRWTYDAPLLADHVARGPSADSSVLAKDADAPDAHVCRVVTYNLLADQYASQEYARTVLFRHVKAEHLDIHYRKQLIVRQLLRSRADLICLQEVDEKVFVQYLQPQLEARGFAGIHTCKAGQQAEGSALFYRRECLRLVGRCVAFPVMLTLEPRCVLGTRGRGCV